MALLFFFFLIYIFRWLTSIESTVSLTGDKNWGWKIKGKRQQGHWRQHCLNHVEVILGLWPMGADWPSTFSAAAFSSREQGTARISTEAVELKLHTEKFVCWIRKIRVQVHAHTLKLVVWPSAISLTSLNISFLICKLGKSEPAL